MTEEHKEIGLRVPLSTYDIFGYVIPGVTLLLFIILFEFWFLHEVSNISGIHTPLYTLIKITYLNVFSNNWVLSIAYLLILLNFSYVIGHVVSSASSLLIDRILIYKGYGYPYETLLNIPSHEIRLYSSTFYKGLFFWTNIYLLSRYISFISLELFYFFNLLSNILGWIIVVFIILKLIIGPIRDKPKSKIYIFFLNGFGRYFRKPIQFVLTKLFPLPYDLLSNMISRFIKTRKIFDSEFIKNYKEFFKDNFKLDPDKSDTNNFWLSYCYVADKSQTLNGLIVNWLHLYSYSRNLSMAFYLSFIYCLFSLHTQLPLSNFSEYKFLKIIPFLIFTIFMVMLIRYFYLYYSYYSKFIFRSFLYLNNIKK